MTRMNDGRYAPAGSLVGMVQRGRGLGARMVAEDPRGTAEVVEVCARWDWRWDDADQRAVYLARLARDTGVGGDLPEAVEGRRHEEEDVEVEEGDVGALVERLEREWVEKRWCGPVRTARALAGFGAEARGAVSLLRRFWLWTPHSHERVGYLEALAAIEPAGLGGIYEECLWDCEEDARLLGVERAPDGAEVRERLRYLAEDGLEEPAVRAAAGERLAALTG
ncbi:hypothetical protein [Streptomyces sp. NRRL S-495]|uniref:hypothetical protein n=1 Tax=Streptomyces sp. NRRL S-495 TaxID=1609133 RepID=UPI0005F8C790|nr:hypothetical protein [Streptomyces sp. NRRL S-495]KJY39251.1 hypothetical protein VR45_03410 [Streptomyces sp. NRRL S-495]